MDVVGLGAGTTTAVGAAGSGYTCARTVDGAAQCRGANTFGTLGMGEPSGPHLTPQPVVGLSHGTTAQVTSAYRHACAVTTAGEVRCWGDNYYGQIGDGTCLTRGAPPAGRPLKTPVG